MFCQVRRSDVEELERALGATRAAKVKSSRKSLKLGFTLVEMLVVITIIGLIMALVGPRVLGYLSESKVKAARIQIESLSSALDLFYLDNGRYPTSAEGLPALVQRPGNSGSWNGHYLKTGRCLPIPGVGPTSTSRREIMRLMRSPRMARAASPAEWAPPPRSRARPNSGAEAVREARPIRADGAFDPLAHTFRLSGACSRA
jgi:type II secretion system protein G